MKITWAPNPLLTVVDLDVADRWWLRECLQVDFDDASPDELSEWLDEYTAALRAAHEGDCTCVPCACLKCQAEDWLGVDTTPGLGKHQAYNIAAAFGHGNERTLDEAIEALVDFDPEPSPMGDGKLDLWNANLPRWREEARQAHVWLVAYRDAHYGVVPL